MKTLFLITGFLASASAFASPLIDCKNPSTGGEFHLGVYADQPPYYSLSQPLIDALEAQGAHGLAAQGSGGTVHYGLDASYSVNTPNGYLSIDQENGGFVLRFVQYHGASANFWFSHGQCRNGAI
ncbi:MAG: hypothetical protein ACXVB9_21595 [Bdellovibrionota bacterium]